MAQDATTIPAKGLGAIKFSDFWKSLFLAAITNILLTFYPIISNGNWPTTADLHAMIKATVALIIGYLLKNLGTNNIGEFLKKDKPVVVVGADKLDALTKQAENVKTDKP